MPRLLFSAMPAAAAFIKIRFQSSAILITLKQSIPITFSNNKKNSSLHQTKPVEKNVEPSCSNKFVTKRLLSKGAAALFCKERACSRMCVCLGKARAGFVKNPVRLLVFCRGVHL
jgi:hypothetical protein